MLQKGTVTSGIHPEHQDPLGALPETLEVIAVPFPGVVERVVGVGDRIGEGEGAELLAKFVGGVLLRNSFLRPGYC